MEIFLGILIPFIGTTLGAACVLFMKKTLRKQVQRALAGFAAGVMVAASIWSLLIPAIEQSENMGALSFIPAAVGFWIGILFLLALDHLTPHFHVGSNQAEGTKTSTEVSFASLFKGTDGRKYISFFSCIIIFYVCWNLLANTFGQFQTYILVKANASQSLATGCGIVLNIVGLICGILFASAAGSKHRNKFFYVGIVIQAGAMIGIALGGGTIAMIVGMIACYNIGNQFAGESIYKVWTQESFPVEARASMQGFINGFSRFCCGLFALVTPYLVAGDRIHTTMYGFAGIVLISAVAGTRMIVLQKKHGIGQM